MSSGLDWERFGVITGGDEVCILPPPTLSEKGVGIPTLSISLKENREKTEEPSLGTSDNGATTAPWQLCKVHT